MHISHFALLYFANLVNFVSSLDPNVTATVPLASVTASVLAGLPACAVRLSFQNDGLWDEILT